MYVETQLGIYKCVHIQKPKPSSWIYVKILIKMMALKMNASANKRLVSNTPQLKDQIEDCLSKMNPSESQ